MNRAAIEKVIDRLIETGKLPADKREMFIARAMADPSFFSFLVRGPAPLSGKASETMVRAVYGSPWYTRCGPPQC